MSIQRWSLSFLLLLFLAACDSEAEQSANNPPFKPISDVVDADLTITDFNNGTASLAVTSNIPLACSIVYGSSTEFGRIATDLDMAGAAHTEHRPLLTELESNTLYYYRVQGVDAAGNIYLSEVMSFTTPDFALLNANSNNLALASNGTVITGYSSIFGNGAVDSQWGVNHAIDGNPNTQWSSDGDGNDAWIELELAAEAHLERIAFWTRTMGTSAEIESFQILTDKGEVFGPFNLSDAAEQAYFEVDFIARRLRFEVLSSSGGNTGAIEIEVYGEILE